jgi:hypothetical protein
MASGCESHGDLTVEPDSIIFLGGRIESGHGRDEYSGRT